METLQISKANALKAINEADENTRKVLKALFGEELTPKKVTDRIKTFDDACKELNIDRNVVLVSVISKDLERDEKSIEAYGKLIIIARALNEGWEPDWSNHKQYKYYPWLEYKSGVGFSCFGYGHDDAGSRVGSRLCFKSEELARYAAKQFQDIYNDFFNL